MEQITGKVVVHSYIKKMIIGSAAIDHMRREVDCIAKIILGLLDQATSMLLDLRDLEEVYLAHTSKLPDSNPKKDLWTFGLYPPGLDKGLETEWLIVAKRKPAGKDSKTKHWFHWGIECCLINLPASNRRLVYATGLKTVDLRMTDVQKVYKELPAFVREVKKKFPFLEEKMWPFWDAADYAEKNGWQL